PPCSLSALRAAHQSEPSIEPAVEASIEPAIEAPVEAGPRLSREEVEAFLIEAFAKETGYPPDLIDVHADLEADLGIDTVKQAQVLGKVRDRFNLRTDEKLALRDFPTVEHILQYVERSAVTAPARPAGEARSRVPMIDVTQRRSKPPKS